MDRAYCTRYSHGPRGNCGRVAAPPLVCSGNVTKRAYQWEQQVTCGRAEQFAQFFDPPLRRPLQVAYGINRTLTRPLQWLYWIALLPRISRIWLQWRFFREQSLDVHAEVKARPPAAPATCPRPP